MIKNKIPVRSRAYNPNKGFRYANHKGQLLVMTILAVVGVLSLLQVIQDPTCAAGMGGTGMSTAAMLALTMVDDVTDRDTHGSAIAYQVILVPVSSLDRSKAFPQPDATTRVVAALPMKTASKGEALAYSFEAHDIPTLVSTTEKGDITTTGENNFVIIMGGDRVEISNFIEQYSGGKFIILFKHVKATQWYILGELERPIILSNTETKDDKDGRYTTFTFKRSSVDLPYLYAEDPTGAVTAEAAVEGGQAVNTASTQSSKK